jgi:D-alanine-D-alanine ligase
MDAAVVAHNGLGCRGITRSDFRYDDAQGGVAGIYLLEINTQPGMTRTSLVPEIAADKGISFGALVEWMVEDAGCER